MSLTIPQTEAVAVIVLATLVFALDRARREVVALAALFVAFVLGLLPETALFSGFASPAVVTIVAVLILTQAIATWGLVERAARVLAERSRGPASLVAVVCGFGAFLSAFMNDVGALALVMPVAISAARRKNFSPSIVLMPLSFAMLLGGTCTLIGTPANLIVSQMRAEANWQPFGFFDLLPIGGPLTVAGIAWLALFGWRGLAKRGAKAAALRFETGRYVTELTVAERSPLIGRLVPDIEQAFSVAVHGVLRKGRRLFARRGAMKLRKGDLLILEAGAERLRVLMAEQGLSFSPMPRTNGKSGKGAANATIEAVVTATSFLLGSTLDTLEPGERWGIDVLAITRQHQRIEGRLADVPISAGDVLLLRGPDDQLAAIVAELGCLPLAPRDILADLRSAAPALGLFFLAIVATACGLASPEIAFSAAVLGLLVFGRLDLRALPRSVDWSVVVMLAAMIPVGATLQTTGAADALARGVMDLVGPAHPALLLAAILAATIGLTAFLNNATTAIVLGPLAASIALQAGLAPDAFLLAVALGASSDFLTPFGHHNNAMVMGSGGYRFLDYPRVGFGLVVLVLVFGPMLILLARGL